MLHLCYFLLNIGRNFQYAVHDMGIKHTIRQHLYLGFCQSYGWFREHLTAIVLFLNLWVWFTFFH